MLQMRRAPDGSVQYSLLPSPALPSSKKDTERHNTTAARLPPVPRVNQQTARGMHVIPYREWLDLYPDTLECILDDLYSCMVSLSHGGAPVRVRTSLPILLDAIARFVYRHSANRSKQVGWMYGGRASAAI
jgi:hypothetical protein